MREENKIFSQWHYTFPSVCSPGSVVLTCLCKSEHLENSERTQKSRVIEENKPEPMELYQLPRWFGFRLRFENHGLLYRTREKGGGCVRSCLLNANQNPFWKLPVTLLSPDFQFSCLFFLSVFQQPYSFVSFIYITKGLVSSPWHNHSTLFCM